MAILGVDGSLNGTGLAIYDDGKIIKTYQIIHDKNVDEPDKFNTIYLMLNMIFNKYDITYVVIERAFCGKNPKTYGQLCHVQGMVITLCTIHNVKYKFITPMSAKQAVLGKVPKGVNTKKLVATEVYKLHPYLSNISNDETDSIALIIAYLRGK